MSKLNEMNAYVLAEVAHLERALAKVPSEAVLTRTSIEARMEGLRAAAVSYKWGHEDATHLVKDELARVRAERDAWSEEAGRRGLALATVEAKYQALLEVCAAFAHGNREGT